MKRKVTMLLTLLLCAFTSSVMAQTLYKSGSRTTTLEVGKQYFISVATYYGGACTNLLYDNNGTLAVSNLQPGTMTDNTAYLFTVEKIDDDGLVYIKNSSNKYLQAGDLASTDTETGMHVVPYSTVKGSVTCGGDVDACDEKGHKIAYADITDETPIVCVYKDDATGWRYIGGLQTAKSTPFAFYESVDGLPELSTEGDIKYYAIKNIRCGNYAYYNGDGSTMQLRPLFGASRTAGKFYFTGEKSDDGTLLTVKIHNAATENLCNGTNSWNETGVDWYIQRSGNSDKPGYAISKENNLNSNDYSWNDAGGNGSSIGFWNGNDSGSTWEFVSVTELEFPVMSTSGTPELYHIRNTRQYGKYANYVGAGKRLTQVASPALGSYWYFVADESVPQQEGWIACKIYNAANGTSLKNPDGTFADQTYYIKKHEWDGQIGFVIKRTASNSGDDGWNDLTGSQVTDYKIDDAGSIWWIETASKTANQLKAEAQTAKTNALATIALYESADYYSYADEAKAAARKTIESLDVTTDLVSAVSGHIAINTAISTLEATEKGTEGPKVGDYIQLKNRKDGKYLKANESDANNSPDNTDTATLWFVEEGAEGYVILRNVATDKYIGQIRQSATVAMTDKENAASLSWTNQTGVYAVFKDYTGGDYAYGHVNGGNLVGWEPGGEATQWVVSNVRPLTLVYKYNDEVLGQLTEIARLGSVYTVSSPYAFTVPGAVTVGETSLEATDGVFSFEVTEAATVTIELEEDLPFVKTVLNEDGSFPDNAAWYVVKQHSTQGYAQAWKYDETNGVTTEATDSYTDNHMWCFAGSKDDLKIYNKVAGSGVSLTNSDPASMTAGNTAVWKMVKSDKEATFAGKDPFCLQKGDANSYLNRQGNKLKYWSAKDEGSTIMVIAQHELSIKYMFKEEELTELSVKKWADEGTHHIITNPFANKYVTAICTVNGFMVDEVDGKWTVPVTEATSVIVTVIENLPFKPSTDFANANWQYMQINSGSWKYVRNDGEQPYSNTTNIADLDDGALWAFVGDALNGFRILNKAAGEGYTLSSDDTKDGSAAYMKQEEKTWTIEKGNGGFVIRQGALECLNDYGSTLKYWNNSSSPQGTGSAFRALGAGVKDLSELANSKIYMLQAERSPLVYDATADDPTKLSSGLVSGVAADATDSNQQFIIFSSETEGVYYLYSLGASKFVDANLNFTDYPDPVLSFEKNTDNPIFPWYVKIGGKYVVPGNNGKDGNKLFHTETPDEDAGKRYRIEEVDEDMYLATSIALTIQHADALIKDASGLSNDKVYTVSTYDRGVWSYNAEKEALWYANSVNPETNTEHFAFLTVAGKTYLYSIGAQKFVVTSGDGYTAYSENPTQHVEILKATGNKYYPLVVALVDGDNKEHHIGISSTYEPPVITFYNDLGDAGNKVDIRAYDDFEDWETVVTKIEDYLNAQIFVPALQELIAKAEGVLSYLLDEDKTSLADAKTAAEKVLAGTYSADQLNEQITALTAAIDAAVLVSDGAEFKNDYVYTFVSKRGWMGASDDAGVISDNTGGADNENFQWAVYTSDEGHCYLYNIGKGQFMGVETRNNTQMPFSATPQTTGLVFKKSKWTDYPIMFSMDNQTVVNNNKNGKMICWVDGWNNLEDEGSNHKVTIVGKTPEAALTAIATAVEQYETQGVAVQALDAAIAAAQEKVNGMGDGLGYYSTSNPNAAAELEAIVEFRGGVTGETAAADIEAQTTAANALIETFSVNLPQPGRFYRFSYDFGEAGVKYVQAVASGASNKANAMVMTEEQGVSSIFCYDGGADAESIDDDMLISYSTGQCVREAGNFRGLQDVGATAGKAKFTAGSKVGKLYIYADHSFHANISGETYFIDHCENGHPSLANDTHNFIVEEVTTLPVTVSAAGWATLYAPVALEIPAEVAAYTAIVADDHVSLREIKDGVIPAGTGVMLKAEQGTYDFVVTTAENTLASDFKGSYAKSAKNPNAKVYTLQNPSDKGVGFYLFKGQNAQGATTYINGFRAWVELPIESNAPSLRIRFAGAGTTAIDKPATDDENAVIYDLTGRRIEKIVEKGIYIVNGVKVVID